MSTQDQAVAVRDYNAGSSQELGLPSPEALNLLDAFAKKMQGSIFLPKALAGHPANILGVVLMGREMLFSPMQSLRMFWVSPDGRIAMYADAMMAAMRARGFKFPEKEFTGERAYLKAVRPDGEEFDAEFTIEDAKTAGLAGKDNYKRYPKHMLRARVIGEVWRFLASDLGGSQVYTREEIEDVEYAESGQEQAEVSTDEFAVGVKPAASETVAPTTETPAPVPETPPAPAETEAPPTESTPPPEDPKPVAQAKAEVPFRKRVEFIMAKISSKPDVAAGVLTRYLNRFLGVTVTPKKKTELLPAIEPLEAVLDARLAELLANPEALADALAGRPAQRQSAVDTLFEKLGWSPETRQLALAVKKSWEHSDDDFFFWLEKSGLKPLKESEVAAMLRVLQVTRAAAWDLMDAHRMVGVSIGEMVEQIEKAMGKPVHEATAAELEPLLAKTKALAQEEARAQKEAPGSEPAEQAEDGDFSLQ